MSNNSLQLTIASGSDSCIQILEEFKHIMTKTLYMLIGPKGSGKTYIGKLIEKQMDISFLRVESIWLSLKPNENAWNKVEQAIDN